MEKVDVDSLAPEQLAQVRSQVQQEIEHLTATFTKIRQATAKFQDCRASVRETAKSRQPGRDLLVPLSSTLYVPGKMTSNEKFLVDIGTDYYVEKDYKECELFFGAKINKLNDDMLKLDGILNDKVQTLAVLDDAFKRRVAEAQAQAQAQKQAQAPAKA